MRSTDRLPRLFVVLLLVALAPAASAHALLPTLWQLTESAERRVEFVWATPAVLPAGVLPPTPRLPAACDDLADHALEREGTLRRERWTMRCANGLSGEALSVEGLAYAGQQVLVQARFADGRTQNAVLDADRPRLVLGAAPQDDAPAVSDYFRLGVEHILLGWDHLAFVAVLVLGGWRVRRAPPLRWLLASLTAFTLGHSLTLAAAALGWVRPLGWLVEAGIAASIVWVAQDAWRHRRESDRAPPRPGIGLAFGLLHGLGFAGVLAEIGLPAEDRVHALLLFNLGIEAGQLLFLLLALLPLIGLADRATSRWRDVVTGGIGVLAGYWFWSRLLFA